MIGEGKYDWLENESGATDHLTKRFGVSLRTARKAIEKAVDRPYFGRGYAVWFTDKDEDRLFERGDGTFETRSVLVHWVHVADLEAGDLSAGMKPCLLRYMEA